MNSIPGGGQLGRMLAAAASLLNVRIVILDVGPESPAKQVISPSPSLSHIDGSFTDPEKILELASKVDILTVEIEHVDADVLEEVQRRTKFKCMMPDVTYGGHEQDMCYQRKRQR
jgi:phosphoribosylaminoimidazole carboxylase